MSSLRGSTAPVYSRPLMVTRTCRALMVLFVTTTLPCTNVLVSVSFIGITPTPGYGSP